MQRARVVRHPVEQHPEPPRVGLGDEPVEVRERPEDGIDVGVVARVAADILVAAAPFVLRTVIAPKGKFSCAHGR